ncbi:hypothetical protein ACF0H5_008131 [Mactra antiquata]
MRLVYLFVYLFKCYILCIYAYNKNDDETLVNSYLSWKLHENSVPEFSHSSKQEFTGAHEQRQVEISSSKSNSSNVLQNCDAFVKEFSKRSSKFIECSVDNARPFRFCERCVDHYQKAKKVYQDIEENDETHDNCKLILLNSDRVQVINSVHTDIMRIWSSADCGKCFSYIGEDSNGTVHFSLTEDTQNFLNYYDNFTNCIPANTTTHNATVCEECNQYYVKMNSLFDRLLLDRLSPHVCMDIVDMMNYTRLTWGDQLNCTNVHKEYLAVSVVAAFLLMTPVVFYVALGVYGTKETRNIIKGKRLFLFEQSQEYGNLDSTSTVDGQSNSRDSNLPESHDTTDQSGLANHIQDRKANSYQTFS